MRNSYCMYKIEMSFFNLYYELQNFCTKQLSKKQKLCPIIYSNVPKKSTGTLIHFDKKITYHAFIRNTAFINFQKLSTHHAYYEHKSRYAYVCYCKWVSNLHIKGGSSRKLDRIIFHYGLEMKFSTLRYENQDTQFINLRCLN